MTGDAAVESLKETLQAPEESVHGLGMNCPLLLLAQETVPVGALPDTEAVHFVAAPSNTCAGVQPTVVVLAEILTYSVVAFELP